MILDTVDGLSSKEFFADTHRYHTVLHQLIVMGEAVKRLSAPIRESEESIPWKQIAGTRDKLVHEYDTVDEAIVWEIVRQELPAILPVIEKLIDRLRSSEPQ